jgi:hypothetical protein
MTRTTRARRAAVPAFSLVLVLSSCGGSGHTDLAGAPGAPTITPAATPAVSNPTPQALTASMSGTAAPSSAASPPTGAPTPTRTAAATTTPTLGPVPVVLDPAAVYDNWSVSELTSHSVVVIVASNSCHGGPQLGVEETATSVTILITEQLFGPPDCHGSLKIVRLVASMASPLGKRYLEGCRPMQEKLGTRVNCRRVKSA